jgi:hypothetical protein
VKTPSPEQVAAVKAAYLAILRRRYPERRWMIVRADQPSAELRRAA